MKHTSIVPLIISLLFLETAFATDASVKFTHSTSTDSITVDYILSGSNNEVDEICLILDYDFSDGFYSFLPEEEGKRKIACQESYDGTYTFTGLDADTTYWLTTLPFKEIETPSSWTWTNSDTLLKIAGGGIGGREIRTQNLPSSNSQSSSNPQNTYQAPRDLPPAGYEDEVLVNMDAYNNPFPDTAIANLSGKAAAELYRRAIIGGYPDGEFKGYRDVNRAEAAKFLLLARYGDVDDARNNGRFPDVLDDQWYTKYVITAANRGIISGHPDGTFRPANTVNTAEFLKMLSLTFGLPLNLSHSYADVSSNDWFVPYVGIAEKYDLFPSRSRYLQPGDPLTREGVAVAIYQYLQNR